MDDELAAIGAGIRAEHRLPERQFSTFRGASLTDETIGTARATIGLLFGAVTLLLVIACANVANLMLVPTIDLSRELAVRVSLGASRGRIVRDVVLESLILAVTGGALGAAFAFLGVEALTRVAPIDLPRLQEVTVDGRVLGFAVVLSVVVGIVVGLAPAFRAIQTEALGSVAANVRRSTSSLSQGRFRDVLVLAQSAMGLTLVIGAGLLMNSLVRLHRVDPGFRTERLHILSVRLGGVELERGPEAGSATLDALLQRVSNVAGVHEASLTTGAPFTSGGWTVYIQPEGVDLPEEVLMSARIGLHQVSGGHLSKLGAHLVSGREIQTTDAAASQPVVVISETLARRYWPNGDAIGSRLVVGGDGTFTNRTIVGVVESPRYAGPASADEEHVYLPYAQFPPSSVDLLLRIDHLDAGTTAALRAAVFLADPRASIRMFGRVDEAMADYFVEPGFYAWVLTGFASIALLLAAVGLSGTLAFSVGQRQREFGIRLALGAEAASLVRGVVLRGLSITSLGIAVGLGGTLMIAGTLEGFVFGVSTTDAPTYAFVSVVFLVIGATASWLPARRAGWTEPVESLRLE